jgi:hypothetical protein
MPGISRLLVALIALAAALGGAASAGAVTWHNSGDTAFTALGGSYYLGPNGSGITSQCAGTDLTGTAATGPAVGAVWAAMHLTATVTNCKFSPFVTTQMTCTDTFTAVLQTGLDVTGSLDSTCTLYGSPTQVVCHIHGQRTALYHDTPPTGYGYLTVLTGGTMVATNGPSTACPYGNGTALPWPEERWTLTAASGGPLHTGPVITRTA